MLGRLILGFVIILPALAFAQNPGAAGEPDLSEFLTVKTAVSAKIDRTPGKAPPQPPYLGVYLEADKAGRAVVDLIEVGSPGDAAGLRSGDVVQRFDGTPVKSVEMFRELLRSHKPGDTVKIVVERDGKEIELSVRPVAVSRPLTVNSRRAVLGIQLGDAEGGARIERVTAGLPAATAGLKAGDVVVRVDEVQVTGADRLSGVLGDKVPGDPVALVIERTPAKPKVGPHAKLLASIAPPEPVFAAQFRVKLKMAAEPVQPGRGGGGGNRDDTLPNAFRKDVYRLAVVAIDYPDVKANPKVKGEHWEQSLFSRNSYSEKSSTGQTVFGSMNDYYHEISCGRLRVEGKYFAPVTVAKKRNDYAADANRFALLTESLDKLHARDGAGCLDKFDGIFFLYSGGRVQTNRGGIYWPHRSNLNYKGKRWSYFICPEGGDRMASISVITHEFGHMLGLPDLYARPETPGAEGVGVWCTMSTGHGNDGKPLHFSAWCKEQLGWLTPTIIDPEFRQKLILSPILNSTTECFKVLVRRDGSEYLLLENRISRSFDKNIPGEGLLIWRVVDGRPLLEESHGIPGPEGPLRFLGSVPYPSRSNNAFTPDTTPSSRPVKPDGRPVHITNIRKLPDGRITFYIGYEYL
jgi:M6 family metalloprotease-like protein